MLAGLIDPERRMNVGKTQFVQVMAFVPWKTFTRIIERHKGDAGMRTLGCADLLCAGLHYDRSVHECVRLGTVSLDQGGHQLHTPLDMRGSIPAFIHISDGKLHDQRIMFNCLYSAKNYPEHLRRIRFKDPESGKTPGAP